MLQRNLIKVTPTFDTSAYADGDRALGITEVPGAVLRNGLTSKLVSLSILDLSNQKQAFDLLIFSKQPTLVSAENAAFDASDANLLNLIYRLRIATTDYAELKASTNAMASLRGLDIALRNDEGGNGVWIVAIMRGAATYAASKGLTFLFGIEQ